MGKVGLYPYQKEAVQSLKGNKHFLIAGTGLGKGFISLEWARQTGKHNIVVVTMASKRDSHDFENEGESLDSSWFSSLSSFSVLSWNGLKKWYQNNFAKIDWSDYAFIFDESHRSKAGVSSAMGRTFLKIAKRTKCWTGYTATPGDRWIDFYPYFVSVNKIATKTHFQNKFCTIQTYKGYPEIVAYRNEDTLMEWWKDIVYFPDTEIVESQLPSETHKTIHFKKPKDYMKVIKTRLNADGELLDTNIGLCHYLRQICATKDKLQWISDFVEGLGERCVIFYNYIDEGEKIAEAIRKVMPKDAKIWFINGKSHDIPTDQTMGKRDVVLAQWTSGSASLNLQFMNYWVSFSPCYSLTVSMQGRGRIKRIGQKKPMFFYYLRCDDTIEEDIYACLHKKQDFSEKTWIEQNLIEKGE